MESLKRQATIAVLWILAAVAMSAHMTLMMLDPVALQRGGQWATAAGAADWISTAAFWLVPLWMSFVATAAGPLVNRWANIVMGVLLTLLNTYHFVVCAIPILPGGPYTGPTVHHILLVGSTVVSTGLVAWFAWTWPGRNARQGNCPS